jgi:hypothetical protein
LGKVLRDNLVSHKACIGSAKAIKVSFAMENHQLSQQRPAGESRREYKSPTLRKLGKLTHMTLAVGNMSANSDGGPPPNTKTA